MDNFQAFDHIPLFEWRDAVWLLFNRRMMMNDEQAAGVGRPLRGRSASSSTRQQYYPPRTQDRVPAPPITWQYAEGAANRANPANQAQPASRWGPPGLPDGVHTGVALEHAVVCTAASGGLGLSVLSALLARALAARGNRCALVDLDVAGGGLDVLLGVEDDPGPRLDTIEAPLGRVEGDALNAELPCWDGVRLLAFDPWRGDVPEWWQVQAVMHALEDANQALIVDAGRGGIAVEQTGLVAAAHVVVVELSVLGLARAKAQLRALRDRRRSGGTESAMEPGAESGMEHGESGASYEAGRIEEPLVVGVMPRGAPRRHAAVDCKEAAAYLGRPVHGPVVRDAALCADVLAGLGARTVGRANRALVEELADWAERCLGLSLAGDD